jgi:hypothetical protein
LHPLALIDGDIIAYSAGFKAEGEPLSHALKTVKSMLRNIQINAGCTSSQVFLTGKDNYRIALATNKPYKGNRKSKPKPVHLADIRKYMIEHHEAIVCEGFEADDALGIAQTNPPEEVTTVLCSIDKDLDMIAGNHYRWSGKREGKYSVTQDQADAFFYNQLLTGDAGDNIGGMYNYCKRRAMSKLKYMVTNALDNDHRWRIVVQAYEEGFTNNGTTTGLTVDEYLTEIGALLWIQREAGKIWTPPSS